MSVDLLRMSVLITPNVWRAEVGGLFETSPVYTHKCLFEDTKLY
jgi:hypothetical protein